MTAPMKAAEAFRSKEIRARERAIKDRLAKVNAESRKKRGPGKPYKAQYIKDGRDGFTPSDYGVGKGAAIPYQIGTRTEGKPKKSSSSSRPSWGSVVNKDTRSQAIQRRLGS